MRLRAFARGASPRRPWKPSPAGQANGSFQTRRMSKHVTSRRCSSLAHVSAVARAIRNLGENGNITSPRRTVRSSGHATLVV
jgi:hypothetical protein